MKALWIPPALLLGFALGWAARPDPREILLEADREFDRVTAARGADGWAAFFADDGKMFRSNGEIVTGREAIRKLMEPLLSGKGNSLRWKPVFGEVARSGELGYTSGTSLLVVTEPDGTRVEREGKYVTLWRKEKDRAWKVALDIGVSGEPRKVDR